MLFDLQETLQHAISRICPVSVVLIKLISSTQYRQTVQVKCKVLNAPS